MKGKESRKKAGLREDKEARPGDQRKVRMKEKKAVKEQREKEWEQEGKNTYLTYMYV